MNAATPTFRKVLAPAEADAEIQGWRAVTRTLPVPRLLGRSRAAGKHVVVYEDVFATGRCSMLLGDVISTADRRPSALPRVAALVDAVCDSLLTAVAESGRAEPLSACVPGLYLDRIRRGGRIDTWYLSGRLTAPAPCTDQLLPVPALANHTFVVNGVPMRLDLPAIVGEAREALYSGRTWVTALTQGDPTEPNIADPLCWLDFQYAGRNTLAGEIAILLWYLLGMGGWLVPTYQADVYARTLHLHLLPINTPRLEHVDHDKRHRRLEVRYSWPVGAGRQVAITQLLKRVRADLAPVCGLNPDRFLAQIRHFLVLRILGVIPPGRLTSHDLLLLLAKLAETQQPETIGETFTRTQPTLTTHPDDRTDDERPHAA
ncbi:hypothetical protein [Kitasatospora acidiphila]|uniref:hypothetical protein n=1 Tax=Kitasatospora acidiphila TaxID=2567942 RepID=UPI003C708924